MHSLALAGLDWCDRGYALIKMETGICVPGFRIHWLSMIFDWCDRGYARVEVEILILDKGYAVGIQ